MYGNVRTPQFSNKDAIYLPSDVIISLTISKEVVAD